MSIEQCGLPPARGYLAFCRSFWTFGKFHDVQVTFGGAGKHRRDTFKVIHQRNLGLRNRVTHSDATQSSASADR